MVDVSSWSDAPASNTAVDGINIAEGCSPGNLNGAIRSVMAGVKSFKLTYDALATSVAGKLSASGAVFTGTRPVYTGEGAMLNHKSNAYASGNIHFVTEGSANPSGASGDIAVFYTP